LYSICAFAEHINITTIDQELMYSIQFLSFPFSLDTNVATLNTVMSASTDPELIWTIEVKLDVK